MVMNVMAQEPAQFNWNDFFQVEVDTEKAKQELAYLESLVQSGDSTGPPVGDQGQWSVWAANYLKTSIHALRVRVGIQGHLIWAEVSRVGTLTAEVQGVIQGILERFGTLDQTMGALTQRLGSVESRLSAVERQNQLMLMQNEMMNRQNEMMFRQMEANARSIQTLTDQVGTLTQRMGTLAQQMGTLNTQVGTLTHQMGTMAEDIALFKHHLGLEEPQANGAPVAHQGFQQAANVPPLVQHVYHQAAPQQHGGGMGAAPQAQVFPTFAAHGLSNMAEFNASYPATA